MDEQTDVRTDAKFDEHNNKLGKVWPLGSELITGINISTLPTLKIYLSDHPFIKDDIFKFNVNFPTRVNTIDIVKKSEHHNMSYISKSENNIPWNHTFPARNRTNFWIIRIGRKEPQTFQKCVEAISSQQLTGTCNRLNVIKACRDKDIIMTNLQENRRIFNKIRHITAIGNKLISLPTKPPIQDHIGYVFKIPLISEWYDSIFSIY